ncbi:MAG: helix-turn-helix transcriptional regulator [Candidatus Omnitrophota bacterium]|jgi:transcriptional regulator with XRE-family HTH domain
MTQTYGDALKERRKVRGITIVELAEKIGVGQAYISRLELGETKFVQEQIEVIRSFLENEGAHQKAGDNPLLNNKF